MRVDNSATVPSAVAVRTGTLAAVLGVAGFSLILPATQWAFTGFGPWTTTGLRATLAGAAAALYLWSVRAPRPQRADLPGLAVVAVGCVLGFPLLTTLALVTTATADAAVVIGALPLATAALASLRSGIRHSPLFWCAAVAGAVVITAFTLFRTGFSPRAADLLLVAAVAVCAAGYAEGGRLAGRMPGGHVIAWALVASLPAGCAVAAFGIAAEPADPGPLALAGVAYLALAGQFGAFIAWYAGMARIGVARAGQVQLAQPLLTMAAAVALLGEALPPAAPAAALAVLACIAVTQRAR